MSDVKWIKLVVDIFEDQKFLLIENQPEADSIMLIWIKVLCLAGKLNNGGVLILDEDIPYTHEMLSIIFRMPVNTIELAISTFEKLKMIEIINDTITIPNWSKHQSLDQLMERKEYMRKYMQKYRNQQKELATQEEDVNKNVNSKVNSKLYSKVNVNLLEGEGELEEELELEREEDIYREIVAYLNDKAGKSYNHKLESTMELIKARMAEGYDLEDFKKVIDTKVASWLNDKKMNNYLRPETLFGPKFEGYLNEKSNLRILKTNYGW